MTGRLYTRNRIFLFFCQTSSKQVKNSACTFRNRKLGNHTASVLKDKSTHPYSQQNLDGDVFCRAISGHENVFPCRFFLVFFCFNIFSLTRSRLKYPSLIFLYHFPDFRSIRQKVTHPSIHGLQQAINAYHQSQVDSKRHLPERSMKHVLSS